MSNPDASDLVKELERAAWSRSRNKTEAAKKKLADAFCEALEGHSERDAIATLLSDRSEPGTYVKVEGLLAALDAAQEAQQTALGALADIGNAEDMTEFQRRHKARRIYKQLAVAETPDA